MRRQHVTLREQAQRLFFHFIKSLIMIISKRHTFAVCLFYLRLEYYLCYYAIII